MVTARTNLSVEKNRINGSAEKISLWVAGTSNNRSAPFCFEHVGNEKVQRFESPTRCCAG